MDTETPIGGVGRSGPAGRGAHILVVDDNPHIRWPLQHPLAEQGHLVRTAEDGLEAMDRVAEEHPDLILLDLDLPGLQGDEVCRRLKTDPATRFIPIVMITAQGDFRNKLAAWEYGADDFLSKPFHLVEV